MIKDAKLLNYMRRTSQFESVPDHQNLFDHLLY